MLLREEDSQDRDEKSGDGKQAKQISVENSKKNGKNENEKKL